MLADGGKVGAGLTYWIATASYCPFFISKLIKTSLSVSSVDKSEDGELFLPGLVIITRSETATAPEVLLFKFVTVKFLPSTAVIFPLMKAVWEEYKLLESVLLISSSITVAGIVFLPAKNPNPSPTINNTPARI